MSIKPIVITDNETNKVYTLQFNRDAIRYAEENGFSIKDLELIEEKPMTLLPDLFHYAFYTNHKEMTKEQTDDILFNKIGGLNEKLIARLCELYTEPYMTLMGDKNSKNSKMTVRI